MKVIYANIVFFLVVLYGLLGAAFIRLTSSFWRAMGGVKAEYDFVSLLCAVWLLVTIVGLIMRKPWAYIHAQSLNAVIAVVPIILFVITMILLWQEIDHIEAFKGHVNDLLFSVVAIAFWFTLHKSGVVKNAYNISIKGSAHLKKPGKD